MPSPVDPQSTPQQPVHVTPGVDAADQLLAEEAALGERDGVELQEGLLGDRPLVDVEPLAGDAGPHPGRLVGGQPGGAEPRRRQRRPQPGQLRRPGRRGRRPAARPASRPGRAGSHRLRAHGTCGCSLARQCRPAGRLQPGGHLGAPQRQAAPAARPVLDLGLDPDPEPPQRGGERLAPPDLAVEPGVVADPQQPQVGVELALGLQEEGVGALPVLARASMSCDSRLWRNLRASGPSTRTAPRAQRSTSAAPSVKARSSVAGSP